jgi:hypothetical protein
MSVAPSPPMKRPPRAYLEVAVEDCLPDLGLDRRGDGRSSCCATSALPSFLQAPEDLDVDAVEARDARRDPAGSRPRARHGSGRCSPSASRR